MEAISEGNALEGKTVLITGASRGIGRAIAIAMADAGAQAAVSARDLGSVEDLAVECGKNALPLALDVSDEGSCSRAVDAVIREFGKIDVLVNNAGIAESAKFLDSDTAMWRRVLTVDLDGAFWMTRAVLPDMLERSYGSVISIGSIDSRLDSLTLRPIRLQNTGSWGCRRLRA